ncbi:hypothetical protein QR685DRAFT_438466, partial [Neurospora intermedia]
DKTSGKIYCISVRDRSLVIDYKLMPIDKEGCHNIFISVDRFFKRLKYILCRDTVTARQTVEIYH